MPRIATRQRGALTRVDLDHYACRLEIGSTVWNGSPCFSLVYRYAPTQAAIPTFISQSPIMDLSGTAMMALVRAEIPLAPTTAELDKVAQVALTGGTQELDIARTREAFELFKNLPRVRAEVLEVCTGEAVKVVELYWQVIGWLWEGAKERKQITLPFADVELVP